MEGPIFDKKNLILEVRYRTFELKIHQKVDLLRPKIMPKQLRNISKIPFKSPKNDFFGPQNGQITGTNFDKSVNFWVYFGPKSSKIASKVLKLVLKSFYLYATHLTTLQT